MGLPLMRGDDIYDVHYPALDGLDPTVVVLTRSLKRPDIRGASSILENGDATLSAGRPRAADLLERLAHKMGLPGRPGARELPGS